MNLQTASDFEINKAVAESLGYVVNPQTGNQNIAYLVDPPFSIGYAGVDYCNQWQDAGPVIQDNKISLAPGKATANVWFASCDRRAIVAHMNASPLRAAMEVYLTMKAGES